MNKLLGEGEPSRQSAKMNRQRLASPGREPILDEIDKRAANVRTNMTNLRALRLAKEAQDVRTEISAENQSTRAKSKKRFR
jgi:hypothetical protein